MVVVAHAQLVAGGGPGRLDAPDQPPVGEDVEHVVDGLGGDLADRRAHRVEHRVGARVGGLRERSDHGEPLLGHAQTAVTQREGRIDVHRDYPNRVSGMSQEKGPVVAG